MGLDAMRIGVHIRRFLVISTRTLYISARKHPILVGMVCFLIFLYRSFPFLFSLLVSVSPVLVCTAVLLGTLLSFGEPNIPEIEKEEEEEHTREISSLKAGVLGDATVVVDKDGDFFVESYVGERRDIEGEAIGEESLEKNRGSKIEEDDCLGDYVPLIDESSREIQFEKQAIDQVEHEFDDLELEKKKGIDKEKQGVKEVLSNGEAAQSHYSLVQNVRLESPQVEYDKSSGESVEAEKVDHLHSQHSSWKRVNDGGDYEEEAEEEEEDASDSGSDGAESSSPDASMADIIPMLDELHPLLNEETPLLHKASPQSDMSRDGFDAGSEQSHMSKESIVESEEDVENLVDREEDGDDDNDNEDDEGAQGGKEDESKSAIKWTEDDEKNLMDLGTLELERNQRLESLIARRRARRNLRSMAEKNLIDFDGADLPINVPPISTTRSNPFDLPCDSYDDVPGSAPSILLPRHNPFDLPYDSNEEKPDLKADSFQQEYSPFQQKEPFFRRHESFSVGPSFLGVPKQERQDLRWKPYFVPERYATEGASHATFQRQLSGASESKLSSAPDTESMSSVVGEEDRKLNEDVSQETDVISNLDHASILVERGSLSSEDIDSADIEDVERRDVPCDRDEIRLGDVENHQELDSHFSTLEEATSVELNTREILLRMEPGDEGYSSRSSLSSLSEVDEKISDMKNGMSPELRNVQIEKSHISTHTLDFHFMSEVADENQHREPVLEPQSNHTDESGILVQSSFDSNFHFTSALEYDNRCMEPILEPRGNYIGDSRISMQASLSSDSQLLSEVEDNDQQKETDLNPSGNHIRESGTSTQASLNSDFHFTGELVDDNQHKEPVYDSCPQPVDKLLSLLSISSDAQEETSGMVSPPPSTEFFSETSEMHAEGMGKDDSDYKEMHKDSLDEHSLDEDESRSRELTEVDNDVMKAGLSGVDLTLDDQNSKNGLIKPELAVEHDAVDSLLSSSNNGSIKDSLIYLEERSNHELVQLQSAGLNTETVVGLHQDVIGNSVWTSSSDQVASEETILDALEKEHLSVAVDVSADSKLSNLESEAVEEHAVDTEGILQLEQNQVALSTFDSEIHVNGFQAMHEKLDSVASSSEHMPSNDLSGIRNEEGRPAPVAEPVLGAGLDVSSTEIKHMEEHSLRKEETLQFKQDYEHSSSSDAEIGADLLQDAEIKLVSSGSNHQYVPSEAESTFESEKQMSQSDAYVVEPSIDDNDESQEPSSTLVESTVEVNIAKDVNVPEFFDHERSKSISVAPESLEYKPRVDEFDFKDNILDKIVYGESGNLLEHPSSSEETLMSSVSKENISEDEDVIKEIDEGLLTELDTVGDFRVKEGVVELLHDEQMTQKSVAFSPDYDLLPSDMADIKPESALLEVRSVTDIELAFKQLHEGANIEEVILPSTTEDQPNADESKGSGETKSDLRVFEAKSSEDTHVSMKQAAERNIEGMSKPSEIEVAGSGNSTEELPVVEVRTINDIDLAFKQINEGVDVEEVILPGAIEQQLTVDESKDPHHSSFDLRVVEARSLEDLRIAMKQASEETIEDMSKPSASKEQPAEVNEVGCSNSTKELPTVDDIEKSGI